MKKFLLFASVLAMAIVGLPSCSSSDDGDDNPGKDKDTSVNLPTPKYADLAATIIFNEPVKGKPKNLSSKYELAMNSLTITEDGDVFFSIKKTPVEDATPQPSEEPNEETIVVKQTAKSFDGQRLILDKNVGYVDILKVTRTIVHANVVVNVDFTIPEMGEFAFSNEGAQSTAEVNSGPHTESTSVTKNLSRTWKVLGSILDLEGDVTVYKEFNGSNLKPICDEAIRQGATLTKDEKKQFDKSIDRVVITQTNLFLIVYSDNTVDWASYAWQPGSPDTFRLTFVESSMGNKYLDDGTTVKVAFKNNLCNLKLSTNITGEKKYKAALTLRLQAAN